MCSLIGDLIIRSLKSLSRVQVRTLPVSTTHSPLLRSCDFRLVYDLLHMDYSGPSSLHRGNRALQPTSHMDFLSPQALLTRVRREKPRLTGHLCLESLICRSHSITHKQNWRRNFPVPDPGLPAPHQIHRRYWHPTGLSLTEWKPATHAQSSDGPTVATPAVGVSPASL